MFLFFVQISAQPTGACYSHTWQTEQCREQRTTLINYLKTQLNELVEKIGREPKNAELYYQRGKFYTNIMYEIGLGFKNVEFDGKIYFSHIDAKAIADFTRAINLSPKAEYYENRGRIYTSYWEREADDSFQRSAIKPEMPDEEIFKKIDKIFLNNANFKTAESDFLKGIELGSRFKTSDALFFKLEGLRGRRAERLGNNEYVAKLIGSTKIADIALADLDFGIEFEKSRVEKGLTDNVLIQMYLLNKARIARNFGRDEVALNALDEAIKTLDTLNSEVCNVYANRADIYLGQQKIDLAIRDINAALERSPYNCRRMLEFRGDIYRKKGELNKAIEDYSTFLNFDKENPFLYRELYWKRGKIYFQIKDYDKTIADFTTAIGSGSICIDDYLWRAKVYRLTGNEKAASQDEKEAQRVSAILKGDKPSSCEYHEQQ